MFGTISRRNLCGGRPSRGESRFRHTVSLTWCEINLLLHHIGSTIPVSSFSCACAVSHSALGSAAHPMTRDLVFTVLPFPDAPRPLPSMTPTHVSLQHLALSTASHGAPSPHLSRGLSSARLIMLSDVASWSSSPTSFTVFTLNSCRPPTAPSLHFSVPKPSLHSHLALVLFASHPNIRSSFSLSLFPLPSVKLRPNTIFSPSVLSALSHPHLPPSTPLLSSHPTPPCSSLVSR